MKTQIDEKPKGPAKASSGWLKIDAIPIQTLRTKSMTVLIVNILYLGNFMTITIPTIPPISWMAFYITAAELFKANDL